MHSEGPCEQKPIKNFGENGAWAYTGTAQIFWVPPIISGTDKATNLFCTHILSIDQNNSPLKISGAVAGGVVRTLKTFKCAHILGASRGLLCDSYDVLFFISDCIVSNIYGTKWTSTCWHAIRKVLPLSFICYHSFVQSLTPSISWSIDWLLARCSCCTLW